MLTSTWEVSYSFIKYFLQAYHVRGPEDATVNRPSPGLHGGHILLAKKHKKQTKKQ